MAGGGTTQEEEVQRLEAVRSAMVRSRQVADGECHTMERVFANAGVGDWGHAPPHVRSIALACRLCRDVDSREAFRLLIRHAEAHASRLLHERAPDGRPNHILLLLHLAEQHPRWRREPRQWHPPKGTAVKQFAYLLRYLLGPEHAVVLSGELFSTDPSQSMRRLFAPCLQDLHRRSPDPPALPITKRMAYAFLAAPAHFDLIRALRWSQVMGLGSADRLAGAIDFTRLAWQLWEPPDEAWWAGVLQWFALHPELAADEIAPILDYVHCQRYGVPEIDQPPSPAFSLKGRTPLALRRLVAEWHRTIQHQPGTPRAQFRPSGLRPGRWERATDIGTQLWTIDEIVDSDTLRAEGLKMHHCVSIYRGAIERGRCSIWSMKTTRGDLVRRATTLEVDLGSRRIIQCRGRCNRLPRADEREVLKQWAEENGLAVAI